MAGRPSIFVETGGRKHAQANRFSGPQQGPAPRGGPVRVDYPAAVFNPFQVAWMGDGMHRNCSAAPALGSSFDAPEQAAGDPDPCERRIPGHIGPLSFYTSSHVHIRVAGISRFTGYGFWAVAIGSIDAIDTCLIPKTSLRRSTSIPPLSGLPGIHEADQDADSFYILMNPCFPYMRTKVSGRVSGK